MKRFKTYSPIFALLALLALVTVSGCQRTEETGAAAAGPAQSGNDPTAAARGEKTFSGPGLPSRAPK